MNGKEQRRAMVLTAVIEGRLAAGEAAELMGVSQRQERRLRRGFLEEGPAALERGHIQLLNPSGLQTLVAAEMTT